MYIAYVIQVFLSKMFKEILPCIRPLFNYKMHFYLIYR